MAEVAKARAGLNTLIRMASAASINRNLEAEDAAIVRGMEAMDSELLGTPANGKASGGALGGIMSAGDVHITYGAPAAQPMPQPTVQPPPVQQPTQPQQSTLSKLAPYLLTAALATGAGAGIPYLLGAFDKETPPPSAPTVVDTDTDTDTQYILELVPDDPPQ